MKNQQGIILVMALSIMAILLSIAIGFAVFIISDINKAKSIDNSIISYYAAESGAERTIFLFRKGGKEKIGDFSYDPINNPTALSLIDKTSKEWILTFPKKWKGPEIKEVPKESNVIVVFLEEENKLTLRTVHVTSSPPKVSP